MQTAERFSGLKKAWNRVYLGSMPFALSAAVADIVGLQNWARDHLNPTGPLLALVNHTGDITDAFTFIFTVPLALEVCNDQFQKEKGVSQGLKRTADFISRVSPYAMAALFLAAAVDAETAQHIIKAGVADPLDLVGAGIGAALAFESIKRVQSRVFPRNRTNRP